MMSDEADLLREVSDPTCPGERLARVLSDAIFPSVASPDLLTLAVEAAVLGNPNLPAPTLGWYLRHGYPPAWLNPAVDLYLLEHPLDVGGLLFRGLCRAALSTMNEARLSDYSPHLRLSRKRARMAEQTGPFWDRWRATLVSLLDQIDPSDR